VAQASSLCGQRASSPLIPQLNKVDSAVDDLLRHPHDAPTIGLILCQTKDHVFAGYALRDMHKPIGPAGYELTRSLPTEPASSLPSIETLETGPGDDLLKEGGT
jgi:hypothetical protein